jgi:GNAT superfamily N-acetyltransferase
MPAEPRLASDDELPAVARLFGAAFVDDPMVTWPFPGDFGLDGATELFDILLSSGYGPLGVVWVVDDVQAAAVWLPPDEAARFLDIESATREALRPLTDDGGARYDRFWDWLGGHVPAQDCWFLDIVAVDRRARGRGLGKSLILHGRQRAHAAGQSAFLETSQAGNVPIYEHLGFHVAAEETAPDGGPTIWFMRSDPPT